MPEGLEIVSVQNVSAGSFDQDTNLWKMDYLYPGQIAYLIIETTAQKIGNLTNHAVVSTPSEETNLDNNEANATVIVEGDEPLTNETDESEDDNSTDGDNSTEEDPVEEEITGISYEEETSIVSFILADDDVGSKAVVSKSVGAVTGNPVFMVLLAFLIIAENIFRRKR